jgi:hypothetical protein
MALQSSGAISISQIKAELGSSSNSLATLSAAAGKAVPHAMSEFYGYSALPSNDKYYANDGGGDYINATASTSPFSISSSQDLSVCMWVRPQNTSTQNHMIINFGNTNSNGNNRMFISYTANVNRILTRYRSNSVNFDVQWALHDNSSVTGISSSTPAWSSTNRGNTNDEGWIMLTMTYDASQSTGANAFRLYWNDGAFGSQATSASGTRTTMNATKLRIGENLHLTDSAGNAHMDFDEIKIYNKVLSASEVSTLWNDGIALDSTATVEDGLITEWTFESGDASDSAGSYTNSITGGTITNY